MSKTIASAFPRRSRASGLICGLCGSRHNFGSVRDKIRHLEVAHEAEVLVATDLVRYVVVLK